MALAEARDVEVVARVGVGDVERTLTLTGVSSLVVASSSLASGGLLGASKVTVLSVLVEALLPF